MKFVTASLLCVVLLTVSAQAEQRIFIIPNPSDGYGVDRCLSTGDSCGGLVASAYCRSQEFAEAVSFRRMERDEVTGATPTANACQGIACSEFVAIECRR